MGKRSIKNASLADSDIPGLRKRIHTKQSTVAQEADRYGVGIETIRRAVRGETFRHIRDYLPETLIPGDMPEHATRNPVPLPSDLEILADAEESLRRVRASQEATDAGAGAVDEFLAKRGHGEGKL